MNQTLSFSKNQDSPISYFAPSEEIGAYELLWENKGATFKRLADLFRENPEKSPLQLVGKENALAMFERVKKYLPRNNSRFGVRIYGDGQYPPQLRDAKNPVELFYFFGNWDLTETPSVAVVGTRSPSDKGIKRTRKLVRELVRDGYTIVSGLASGVDTVAHKTALISKGNTIAVIGTPMSEVYPRENAKLQEYIAANHLVISQVPFLKYLSQDYRSNRSFFPERNKTMSALSLATVIVEASDRSGTLYQARAALAQNRRLFILNSCFENKSITWPERFEKKGAIRVRSYGDIKLALKQCQS